MVHQVGTLLRDRYRIDGYLGKGGMGTVYLAFDTTLQIKVALKENHNMHPEAERQFRREATLLASLRHPNLPRVSDHFILGDRQYLVMDFVEGVDLSMETRNRTPSVTEVLGWADELCDGLRYLHTRQPPVIHRDIKPANIKLQPDGSLMLVDFGIAKLADQSKTTTGARGLTPGFSPPEQYGEASTDHRSDQYALAATLYNFLTGQKPADSIERLFKKVELKSLRTYNVQIPEHIDAIILKALSLEPDDRFDDIVHFRSALRGQVAAETIRIDKPITMPKPKRKIPGWVFIGGFVLLVLGAGGVYGVSQLLQRATPAPTPVQIVVAANTPTDTAVPMATSTPEPTATASLTPEPTPTFTAIPTVVSLGGGGKIAFVSDRGDEGWLQIWTMNADGTNPSQLTFGPGDKQQPRWSSDGMRLAYVSSEEGNTEIFTMNSDGTQITNVTQNSADDYDPAWAADDSQLAFTSMRQYDTRQVFIIDLECPSLGEPCVGSNPHNISKGYAAEHSPVWPPANKELPTWMPEPKPIAVAISIRSAPNQIYFRSDPGDAEPLDFDRGDRIVGVEHLDWSPDGQFMVFTWKQPRIFEIYTIPIADRGARWEKLTNSLGNVEPRFSPDGQYIIFSSTRDQNPEIYIMTVSGADQRNLTLNPNRDMQPDWQPPPP
jgi:eukaryotic-like serine/threonine-protein kinase